MRVIGGKYRHRLLQWPDDAKHIRPTKDRIREAIFNALGNIEGMTALDLYSGSGSMGIEALSRGVKHATFVDINRVALSTTKNNILSLKVPNNEYQILGMEDMKALVKFHQEGTQFDLIILDPPYQEGKYKQVIDILLARNILKENGILVIEVDHELTLPIEQFKKIKEYKYGEIKVTIMWR
jgi:16S rRNA (guanine(966)-N(2))-methyltransferase RsmD